uniref:Uncharacterized protein n=1 Tax=Arundo donax TaxID=35708 RepID=A0A0A8ZPY3_ARUDO
MKQTVKQSLKGCGGSLRRIHEEFGRGAEKFGRSVSRRAVLLTLIPFATVATVGGMSYKR